MDASVSQPLTAAALLVHAICAQERFDEAEEYCRIAREIGADDDFATQVLWRSAQAKVLAARGQHAEAADLARWRRRDGSSPSPTAAPACSC
jgi:ATP/maltotriose-dependent transcriptional regulator MalT